MQKFSIKESISNGWKLTKAHFGLVAGATVVYLFFSSSLSLINGRDPNPGLSIPMALIGIVLSLVISIGYLKLLLSLHHGEHPKLSQLFTNWSTFWKYIGGSILSGLITVAGVILLVIPGFYFAIKYSFTTYLIIDQGLGPVEALKKSAVLTKGVKWKLLGFGILLGLINIAGAIVFLVGLLLTIPATMFALIHAYRTLLSQSREEVVSADPGPASSSAEEPAILA